MERVNDRQIKSLAGSLAAIGDVITEFYADPAHEEAFRTWCESRGGAASE